VIFLKLFSRRWWLPTVIILLGMALLAWLGFWQLDRLAERRAFNSRVAAQWKVEPFNLNRETLPGDIEALAYRRVQVQGRFDYANQIVLKNQSFNGTPGVHLVTPLVLENGQAVLVARGWVPYEQSKPEAWPPLQEPADGPITGFLQESQTVAGAELPASPQTEWFRVDVGAIQRQMPYELLPAFVYWLPEPGRAYSQLPVREEPIELSEGNHLSYAFQWYIFALILGFGYVQLVRQQERRTASPAATVPLPNRSDDNQVDLPTLPHQV